MFHAGKDITECFKVGQSLAESKSKNLIKHDRLGGFPGKWHEAKAYLLHHFIYESNLRDSRKQGWWERTVRQRMRKINQMQVQIQLASSDFVQRSWDSRGGVESEDKCGFTGLTINEGVFCTLQSEMHLCRCQAAPRTVGQNLRSTYALAGQVWSVD